MSRKKYRTVVTYEITSLMYILNYECLKKLSPNDFRSMGTYMIKKVSYELKVQTLFNENKTHVAHKLQWLPSHNFCIVVSSKFQLT